MLREYCQWIVQELVLFICFANFSETLECYPPNEPYGGYYTPRLASYKPRDNVQYLCQKNYMGENDNSFMTCGEDGHWYDALKTFCDGPPVRLSYKVTDSRRADTGDTSKIADGDINSCYESSYDHRITCQGRFDTGLTLISGVRIYGLKGYRYRLEVFAQYGMFGINQTSCGLQDNELRENKWIVYRCPEYTWGDTIFVKDWLRRDHILPLCEVEVIKIQAKSCDPPMNIVANGYLEYRRSSAILKCFDGFVPSTTQPTVCQNSDWQTNGFYCIKDDNGATSDIAIVGGVLTVFSVLLIILICGYLLWKRKRTRREPSVSCSEGSQSYYAEPTKFPRDRRIYLRDSDVGEHEYSQVRYSGCEKPTYVNVN